MGRKFVLTGHVLWVMKLACTKKWFCKPNGEVYFVTDYNLCNTIPHLVRIDTVETLYIHGNITNEVKSDV